MCPGLPSLPSAFTFSIPCPASCIVYILNFLVSLLPLPFCTRPFSFIFHIIFLQNLPHRVTRMLHSTSEYLLYIFCIYDNICITINAKCCIYILYQRINSRHKFFYINNMCTTNTGILLTCTCTCIIEIWLINN